MLSYLQRAADGQRGAIPTASIGLYQLRMLPIFSSATLGGKMPDKGDMMRGGLPGSLAKLYVKPIPSSNQGRGEAD